MKNLILVVYLLIATAHAKPPVVFKKGMIITCPADHAPVYKFVKTLREGEAIKSDMIVNFTTGKHPKKLDGMGFPAKFECDSVVTSWRGVCIHSNKGWLPKACQAGLRIKLDYVPVIE